MSAIPQLSSHYVMYVVYVCSHPHPVIKMAVIVRPVVMRGIIQECHDDPLHCTTSFVKGMSEIAFLLAS